MNEDASALEYAKGQRKHFGDKADTNKRRTNWLLAVIIVASLATPLFVTLGVGVVVGKVVPSVLSLLATAATTWMQVRKPNDRWALYRGAERAIEFEIARYSHGVEEYDVEKPARDKLLARRVARLSRDTHTRWESLVPDVEQVQHALSKRKEGDDPPAKPALPAAPSAMQAPE